MAKRTTKKVKKLTKKEHDWDKFLEHMDKMKLKNPEIFTEQLVNEYIAIAKRAIDVLEKQENY